MEENNPFSGIKTCDSYARLLELTVLVVALQTAASICVYFWELRAGVKLSPFEGILPALLLTGGLSWRLLAGLDVSWRGALAGWKRGLVPDALKSLKYFAGYFLVLCVIAAALYAGYYLLGDRLYSAGRPLAERNIREDGLLKGVAAASRLRFLAVLFSACVAAPVVEEVFFRRIVYTTLRLKKGFWPSAFWSSLLFALFHGVGAPVILPIGVYFCWVYERERRLPLNIMLHSLVNLSMISLKVLIK